jgi:hypothetical protein
MQGIADAARDVARSRTTYLQSPRWRLCAPIRSPLATVDRKIRRLSVQFQDSKEEASRRSGSLASSLQPSSWPWVSSPLGERIS